MAKALRRRGGHRRDAASAIQIHGGVGFTWDCDAHLHYRRAKQADLLLGSRAGTASASPTWSSPPPDPSFWVLDPAAGDAGWSQNG